MIFFFKTNKKKPFNDLLSFRLADVDFAWDDVVAPVDDRSARSRGLGGAVEPEALAKVPLCGRSMKSCQK
jgi:hypothetical protein